MRVGCKPTYEQSPGRAEFERLECVFICPIARLLGGVYYLSMPTHIHVDQDSAATCNPPRFPPQPPPSASQRVRTYPSLLRTVHNILSKANGILTCISLVRQGAKCNVAKNSLHLAGQSLGSPVETFPCPMHGRSKRPLCIASWHQIIYACRGKFPEPCSPATSVKNLPAATEDEYLETCYADANCEAGSFKLHQQGIVSGAN